MIKPRPACRSSLAFLPLALVATLVSCGEAPPSGEPLGEVSQALFANDKTCFDYFVSKGLTSFQAAGIVGNLDQESGTNPNAVQSGGAGRGIAQWSVGGRWDTDAGDNAEAYASQQGQSVWSLQLQLDFIWYELTSFPGYGLGPLKATTNVTDATVVFQDKFEGCGTCIQSQRVDYAMAVLNAYGSAPPYAAQFVSQSFPVATTTMMMTEGQVTPSYIELKNVGAKTWDSNTKLATTQPRDRASVFDGGSWPAKNRLAVVSGTVPPGGTYKFQFDLTAPGMTGTFDEFFGVVQEGVAWFSDPGEGGPPDNDLEVKIQVVLPKYRGEFKDQSFPLSPAPLTVHVGDVAKGYIELTNTGSATWQAGVVKLAPIPRDKASPFADPSWLSPTRVSTVAADVPPNSVGRFDVALDATMVGDTEIGFGLVEEGVAWFSDPGEGGPADGSLKVHLVVDPPEAPDAGMPPPDDAGSGASGGSSTEAGGEGGAPGGGSGGAAGSNHAGAAGAAGNPAGGTHAGGTTGGNAGFPSAGAGSPTDGGVEDDGGADVSSTTSSSSGGCRVGVVRGSTSPWWTALVGLFVVGASRRRAARSLPPTGHARRQAARGVQQRSERGTHRGLTGTISGRNHRQQGARLGDDTMRPCRRSPWPTTAPGWERSG